MLNNHLVIHVLVAAFLWTSCFPFDESLARYLAASDAGAEGTRDSGSPSGGGVGGGSGETGGGAGDAGPVLTGGGAAGGERDGGMIEWSQRTYLKASNSDNWDRFGTVVAISGDGLTMAVGAPGESSWSAGTPSDNSTSKSGAVYVFVRSGGTWSFQAYLKAPHPDENDSFGTAVALSANGNTLAIGADRESSNASTVNGNQTDNSAQFAGAVYVFTRTGTAWRLEAYVKASDAAADSRFGSSVSLSGSGDRLAIGAYGHGAYSTGAAYVFSRTGSGWISTAFLRPPSGGVYDLVGASVAISEDGSTVAVGAPWDIRYTGGHKGAVYVFNAAGGAETLVRPPTVDFYDEYGAAVALNSDGTLLLVGAPKEDSAATGIDGNQNSESGNNSGAAYLFRRSGTTWSLVHYIKAATNEGGEGFGSSVDLSGDGRTVVVGAANDFVSVLRFEAEQMSSVALHERRNGWTGFGLSVTTSSDGKVVACGAPEEDSNATGVGGNELDESLISSGAVFAFTFR